MKFLLLAIFFVFLNASNLMIVPYIGYLTYKNSIKNKAGVYGGYVGYFKFPSKIDVDVEHLRIEFEKSSNITVYLQKDLTLIYSYYKGEHLVFKTGVHNIFISQKYNKDTYDRFFILGLMWYKFLQYNLGFDFYRSSYDNSLKVYQFTPYFGFNFGNYYSAVGSFYFDIKFNYIFLNKNVARKKFYDSVDAELLNFHKIGLSSKLSFYLFPSVYRVTKGGFVVYNLKEEYKKIYNIELAYSLNDTSTFKISYSKAFFTEEKRIATANVFVAIYSKSF